MNKKAVSVIIGYVILILIVMMVAGGVYVLLDNYYMPVQKDICPDGVSLIIRDVECSSLDDVQITFENKGLFDVDGAYIKVSDKDNLAPYLDVKATEGTFISEKGFFYFSGGNGLRVGNDKEVKFNFEEVYGEGGAQKTITEVKKIWVQPFVTDRKSKEIVQCLHATIVIDVECS
ncbi:MAG: hypothetical protein U9Q06_03165 [Nanoarchaeota archaeon]|nr:hypothetical protein [Nanoarchaeota archaeon]